MTFTATLTSGPAHEVYGGLTACDDYLFAAVSAGAKKYRALPANGDDRKRLLVQATRWIDDILSAGTPTGAGGTTLQVPMEGVTDAAGNAMSDADQLALAERATFEAVAILAADQDAALAADTGSNIKILDADGTKIEFFRPTSATDGTALAIPAILGRILGPLIAAAPAAASTAFVGASNGTGADSRFDTCDAFTRVEPF